MAGKETINSRQQEAKKAVCYGRNERSLKPKEVSTEESLADICHENLYK